MIHGDSGSNKSVVLCSLAERLQKLPDVTVGAINHSQRNLADFYRELIGEQVQIDSGHFGYLQIGETKRPLMAFVARSVLVMAHLLALLARCAHGELYA